MRSRFLDAGWIDLDNARRTVIADGRAVAMVGVDDPHIQRARYDAVSGPPPPDADATTAPTPAPYRRVPDASGPSRWPLPGRRPTRTFSSTPFPFWKAQAKPLARETNRLCTLARP